MIAAGKAGVPLHTVGKFGGDHVTFGAASAPFAVLATLYERTFGQTFA